MNYAAVLILVSIVFLGCSSPHPWVAISAKISQGFIQDMEDCGCQLYASGGGMMDDIESVTLCFQTIFSPDIAQARMIFVDSMEELLNRYNTSEKARNYLHNFPFTNRNIKLKLRFLGLDGNRLPEGLVTYVSNINGIILYCSYDPDPNNPNHLKVLFEEPYEEALRILDLPSQPMHHNPVQCTKQ